MPISTLSSHQHGHEAGAVVVAVETVGVLPQRGEFGAAAAVDRYAELQAQPFDQIEVEPAQRRRLDHPTAPHVHYAGHAHADAEQRRVQLRHQPVDHLDQDGGGLVAARAVEFVVVLGNYLPGEIGQHREGAPVIQRDADHLMRVGHELDQRGTLAAGLGGFAAPAFDQQPLRQQLADQGGDGRLRQPGFGCQRRAVIRQPGIDRAQEKLAVMRADLFAGRFQHFHHCLQVGIQ